MTASFNYAISQSDLTPELRGPRANARRRGECIVYFRVRRAWRFIYHGPLQRELGGASDDTVDNIQK